MVTWLLCTDWVFQWHRWFVPVVVLPYSCLGRFGILLGVVLLGLVPAALLRKSGQYRGIMGTIVFAPLLLLVFGPLYFLSVPPFVFKYPRRILLLVTCFLRWSSSSLVGKAVSLAGVVVLTWALPRTWSAGWIRAELVSLAVAMMLMMAGILHLASSPLSYVDSTHKFLFRLMNGIESFLKRLSGGKPDAVRLTSASGFAQAMIAELDEVKGAWRYFITFAGGLMAAFALAVLAFASTYGALNRLTPTGLGLFSGGYPACISLSFGVITTLYVPSEMLFPMSAYTLAVFAEFILCFYLATVTVWAFTAGARRNTVAMVRDLKAMWNLAVQGNVEQLREIDPSGSWEQDIVKTKDDWLRRLR